ncbi:50S ribosomal protein L13 [Thermacetogenium phaeum DSM 12270]|uniref:Large ribosomal subunit protein uL13 n=1 Tax=Thermacetogenium phaeum (strain ATCC BAA-254 / DSM 26808 / PB) TaxID=1089553 RepID=K4LIJ9_THEPS|nr:50S ribosomal protein L13 [Thermacetogenium phaeum]AFV12728.1 50S ribosomal protein L13 [Thermacetogenium phaeum DSM 12270]
MRTYMAKPGEVERKWYLIDATGKTLGRLASEVARILRGKHKPTFTPHVDTGDHVIVINAEKVKVTGKKFHNKLYIHHSGYPGGLKVTNFATLFRNRPERVIERAVWGMIPHNRLGRQVIKKLRVYRGPDHPHAAQRPEAWEISG